MANRRRKNLIIILLFTLLVFMGVGYAVLSQTLTIGGGSKVTGKWYVYIQSITPTTEHGKAKSRSAVINGNKISASFTADLYDNGDYVEYTVVVKNGGNIPAKLSTITPTITNSSEFINFSTTAKVGDLLGAGQTHTFTVKIAVSNDNNGTATNSVGIKYDLTLNYIQTDQGADPNIETDPIPTVWALLSGDISATSNDDVSYTYYNNGNITISGVGAVRDFIFSSESNLNSWPLMYKIIMDYIVDARSELTSLDDLLCGTSLCRAYEEALSKISSNSTMSEFETFWNNPSNAEYILGKEWLYDIVLNFPGFNILTIESGITRLGKNTFRLWKNNVQIQENITIPNTVSEIGEYAFAASNFKEIVLPTNQNFTVIPECFCGNCSNLNSIIIPNSVTTISTDAFYATVLTSVIIPSSVTTIGASAFSITESLTSITVNRSATGMTLGSNWCGISDCTAAGGRVTYSE